MARVGRVTLSTSDPPLRVNCWLAEEQPRVEAGYGGWDEIARPRRAPLTTFRGLPGIRMTLPLMLDEWATQQSVEPKISDLMAMGRMTASDGEPPQVTISAPGAAIRYQNLLWVVTDLTFGDFLVNNKGNRCRQQVTVALLEYIEDVVLANKSAANQARAKAAQAKKPPGAAKKRVAVANSSSSQNGGNGAVRAAPRTGAPLAVSYYHAVMADNPIAYWRLAEQLTGDPAVDETDDPTQPATANDGAYTGGVTLGVPGATAGGTAALLNGTSGYINVPYNANLDLADGPLTLEAWAQTTVYTADQTVIDKGANGYGLRLTVVGAALRMAFVKSGAGTIVQSNSDYPKDGKWHHFAATKNGATVHLYRDGVDVTGTVTNQTLANTTAPLTIGVQQPATRYMNGAIDEVAVYNTELTAARVLAHYQAAPVVQLPPPPRPTTVVPGGPIGSGETLVRIAAMELGDCTRWPEIAALNNIRDPRATVAGQVIRLP